MWHPMNFNLEFNNQNIYISNVETACISDKPNEVGKREREREGEEREKERVRKRSRERERKRGRRGRERESERKK